MNESAERLQWVVTARQAGVRLDHFLTERGVLGTRSQVSRLIGAGLVWVDEQVRKAGTRLRAGQTVSVARPVRPAPSPLEPAAIDLDVLYEDNSVLAINKPPGLVVHPAPGHREGTLVNALLHRWGPVSGMDPNRLGIVHRLDKDTSGVLIVAKSAAVLAALARQFRRRQVEKQYVALAWGRFKQSRGIIRASIARDPVQRKRMAVREGGREAVTRYEVLEVLGPVSYLRLRPETGRTHQLRVHLASLGHPIVADTQYARRRRELPVVLERQALHAELLCFRHPVRNERLTVRAPLPVDFAAALAGLRNLFLTSNHPLGSVPHLRGQQEANPARPDRSSPA